MVDTKSKSNKVVKPTAKSKESKADRFLRLATRRVENVLKSLRILGNCSSRGNYEYTQEQVESMFESIQVALNNAEGKFTPSKTEQETFKF